ncbi:hypothetical protein JW962_00030 [Candidatus Dojkabacteria bacterium]|nr:hypothetical protein [Candidatus Dojkabacteria bacterium]
MKRIDSIIALILVITATVPFILLLTLKENTPIKQDVLGTGGVTYYVSTTGDDNNTGTRELPWRTINKAANYTGLNPGDTVCILPGDYAEEVRPGRSGVQGARIVFSPCEGGTVRIGKFLLNNISYIEITGFEFVQSLTNDSWEHFAIQIKNNSNYNLIKSVKIHDFEDWFGIKIHGQNPIGNIVETSQIWNMRSLPYTDVHGIMISNDKNSKIQNNSIWNIEGDCIQTYPPDSLSDKGNTYILNNHLYVEDSFAIGAENAIDIKQASQTGTFLVSGNIIHGFRPHDASIGGSGGGGGSAIVIHQDYSDNITLNGNYIYNCYKAIWIAKDYAYSNIKIQNNIISNIKAHPWSIAGETYAIMFYGNLNNIIVENNTFLDTTTSMYFMPSLSMNNSYLRNNLFYNAGTIGGSNKFTSVSNNAWFNTTGTLPGANDITGSNLGLVNFVYSIPGTSVSIPAGTTASSAVINKGIATSLTTDFLSHTRDSVFDIGAIEYIAPATPENPNPPPENPNSNDQETNNANQGEDVDTTQDQEATPDKENSNETGISEEANSTSGDNNFIYPILEIQETIKKVATESNWTRFGVASGVTVSVYSGLWLLAVKLNLPRHFTFVLFRKERKSDSWDWS